MNGYFLGKPLDLLVANSDVVSVEHYKPLANDLPPMDDVPSPSAIIEIHVKTVEDARNLIKSSAFEHFFINLNELTAPWKRVHLEVFDTVHYPIPGFQHTPPRNARLSFVVRYYGAPSHQREFEEFYTLNHPPLLAQFPGIRNVICYLPLDVDVGIAINQEHTILGNEVVFDDLGGLSAALDSEAMLAVMEDSAGFPTFTYSSHHVMLRTLVHSCGKD